MVVSICAILDTCPDCDTRLDRRVRSCVLSRCLCQPAWRLTVNVAHLTHRCGKGAAEQISREDTRHGVCPNQSASTDSSSVPSYLSFSPSKAISVPQTAAGCLRSHSVKWSVPADSRFNISPSPESGTLPDLQRKQNCPCSGHVTDHYGQKGVIRPNLPVHRMPTSIQTHVPSNLGTLLIAQINRKYNPRRIQLSWSVEDPTENLYQASSDLVPRKHFLWQTGCGNKLCT